MKSRAKQILEKSISAMLSALEIYNKPDFKYREESFAILAVNAWELLFKSRLLQLGNNRLKTLHDYEKRQLKNGTLSKKLYRKTNRSGNYATVGIFRAQNRLESEFGDSIDLTVKSNIEALTEVRDNAIHFLNMDISVRKTIYELGSATVLNYLHLVRQWFGVDLRHYNVYLMPIAFLKDIPDAKAVPLNIEEKNLLIFIQQLESKVKFKPGDDYSFSLEVELRFKKGGSSSDASVVLANDPAAIPVALDEEQIREKYPWSYEILTNLLQKRYEDFKVNPQYHGIRQSLEGNVKYCKTRFLDPANLKSAKKNFYNPNIVREFDKLYKKRFKI